MTRWTSVPEGRRLQAAAGLLVVLVAAAVGGCAGPRDSGKAGLLVPRKVPFVPDAPLPEGFELIRNQSHDAVSGTARYVWHRYEGRAESAALRAFYKEQMPAFRWTLVDDYMQEGTVTMRFEKGTEACTVEIHAPGGGWAGRTVIYVRIIPFDRSQPGGGLTR